MCHIIENLFLNGRVNAPQIAQSVVFNNNNQLTMHTGYIMLSIWMHIMLKRDCCQLVLVDGRSFRMLVENYK